MLQCGGCSKNTLKPCLKEQWCIPKASAEFVARMEDLLDLYEEPDAPQRPRVRFDERPCQLLADNRASLAMIPGHPLRFDYEYTRHGTCNLFIMAEPFQGWRYLMVTPRRTKQELAQCMAELVDVHFPKAEKIRVILDNLSFHTPAALYEVFAPADARRFLRKLEFHLTPVHGSWVNMAEIELTVPARQCLNRRIPDVHCMAREGAAWETRRNRHRATIDWRFTTKDARLKLKSLYPKESASQTTRFKVPALHETLIHRREGPSQVPTPRWAATLIVHHSEHFPLPQQTEHRLDEVLPVTPIQPGRAHNVTCSQ
jgi:hypothetical protein